MHSASKRGDGRAERACRKGSGRDGTVLREKDV